MGRERKRESKKKKQKKQSFTVLDHDNNTRNSSSCATQTSMLAFNGKFVYFKILFFAVIPLIIVIYVSTSANNINFRTIKIKRIQTGTWRTLASCHIIFWLCLFADVLRALVTTQSHTTI